ncbi:MAG: hypothetical protein AAF810_16445 [Cyanobacteria bacterium P01_D01_bin.36]
MTNQSTHQPDYEPTIVRIDMLDTDYAKMVAGESIDMDRRDRLESTDSYTFNRLEKQLSRYRYGQLGQEGKDDILCDIGLTAELLNQSDMEDIHQRMRETGRFYLTDGERQQIINWLKDELAIDLMASVD